MQKKLVLDKNIGFNKINLNDKTLTMASATSDIVVNEEISLNENGEKIEVKGDPIIQIGTTFHRYGDQECYNRSIVVIGNEDKPDEKVCDSLNEYGISDFNDKKVNNSKFKNEKDIFKFLDYEYIKPELR